MTFDIWLAFVIATLILSISPGAGATATISTTLSAGNKAALANILGLQLALILQITIVAIGVGAIVATSEPAFLIIKYVGTAYLVYVGLSKLYASAKPMIFEAQANNEKTAGFFVNQAFWINISNPKSILFFAAFLPQFVDNNAPVISQYFILGLTVVIIDVLVMIGFMLMASTVKPWLSSRESQRWLNRVFGVIFILLGIVLALTQR